MPLSILKRLLPRQYLCTFLSALCVLFFLPSLKLTDFTFAQEYDPIPFGGQSSVHVEIGKGVLIPNTASVEAVFVSDPEVADVKDSPEETIFLFGKKVGTTNIVATDTNGKELFRFIVIVSHQISEIRDMLRNRFPNEAISVRSSRGSIMVSGVVSNERVHSHIFASLKAAVPETAILDETKVLASNLIRLDVKLLEVNKNQAERFGVDINALIAANGFSIGIGQRGRLFAGYNPKDQNIHLSAMLDLLLTNQVATIKTETSLSAISGKQATFEVGGEIPIPSFTTDGNTRDFSLTYKFVGLLLQFIPLRLEEDKVLLSITTSVSNTELSTMSVNGNEFPMLNTRRFKTDVELSNKQSFLIAGLSQQASLASLRLPRDGNQFSRGLASLFSNNRVQDDKRELIILVTTHFQRDGRVPVKTDVLRPRSNLEYLIARKTHQKSITIHGAAGFLY